MRENARSSALAVADSVAYGARGGSDVDDQNKSLEFVMACFVEEVAQGYYSGCFSNEVDGESWSGASEDSNNGIQFPAAVLQIEASDGEVGSVQSRRSCEQQLIVPIPELVLADGGLWG